MLMLSLMLSHMLLLSILGTSLVRQLGLKAFSVLLLPKIAERIYLLKASLHVVDILFDTRSCETYFLDDPLR